MKGKRVEGTYTRKQLHEQVWSIPLSKAASDLGVADRVLINICREHFVPIPGPKYWIEIETGQNASKTPLKPMRNPENETINLENHGAVFSPVISDFKTSDELSVVLPKKETSEVLPVKPKLGKEGIAVENALAILDPVRRFNPYVAGVVSALKTAKPDSYGEISTFNVHIHPSTQSRLSLILHYLAKALETLGIEVLVKKDRLQCSISPDSLTLEIREKRRRQKHQPTQQELRQEEAYKRKHTLALQRGEWLSWHSFWPEFDYFHEGKISIEVLSCAVGERRKWSDSKRQQLEAMIDTVANGVLLHLVHIKVRRVEWQEQERRHQHLTNRRSLQKKRSEREDKRKAFLDSVSEYQTEAVALENTLSSANDLADISPEYGRMLAWATVRLASLKAQNSMLLLTERIKKLDLFPEQDTLFDPEGEPAESRSC